ncbi:MAG TPA: hypothetical protein VF137_02990 [Candidatus Dormibacteraeota bacterium]
MAKDGGSSTNHSSHSATATTTSTAPKSSTHTTSGPMDQDVPSGKDPSWKSGSSTETRDNGKGNDCDPGFGGSNNETGNDGGHHGVPNASETEATGCHTTSGTQQQQQQQQQQQSQQASQVAAVTTTGHGGGVEAATGGVLGASGGIGGGVGAAGVALANTGLRSIGYGALALLLIVLGGMLMWRRPRARSTL